MGINAVGKGVTQSIQVLIQQQEAELIRQSAEITSYVQREELKEQSRASAATDQGVNTVV